MTTIAVNVTLPAAVITSFAILCGRFLVSASGSRFGL
jgi:hypothetical protein